MALLAVAVMAVAYVLTSRLNAASQFVGIDREHNAKALNRAKQALIGYMAQQAAMPGENNPGHLPCPEAPANFGTSSEGIEASFCAAQALGRLPWRTLGLEKLVDAAGEPLWYAVSNGWHRPNSTATLTINSDSVGQLNVDGPATDVVALIIAPGAAIAAQAGAGCAAWVQSHPSAGPPDLRNYLECDNATFPADASFVTSAPGHTFNDQVLRVTTADVLPALEAAIAHRMEREIVPALRGIYSSAQWGGIPLFAYPAPFGDPGASNYKGVAAIAGSDRPRGLLPFTSSDPGCGGGARCDPNFVTWNTGVGPTVAASGGLIVSSSCSFPNASTVQCTGVYAGTGTVTLSMTARAINVAMALRTLAPNNMTVEYGLVPYGPPAPASSGIPSSGSFNSDGSAALTLRADVPGLVDGLGLPLNVFFRLTADLGVIADHALLNPADPTTGWFVRNEWYRLTYYAVALKNTAFGLPPPLACNAVPNCLGRSFPTPSINNIRSLIILAGRSMSGMARPNGTLSDYLEFQNNDGDLLYEQRPVSRVINAALMSPFNDRVLVVDTN